MSWFSQNIRQHNYCFQRFYMNNSKAITGLNYKYFYILCNKKYLDLFICLYLHSLPNKCSIYMKILFCYGTGVTTIVAKSIQNVISMINNNNLFIALISLKHFSFIQTSFRQRHVNPMVSKKWYVDEPRRLYWKQTLDIAGWRTLLWHLTQCTGDT